MTYEGQAKFSVTLAGASLLAMLAAAAMILGGFDWEQFYFVYGRGGLRFYAVLLAILTALATGGLGLLLGIASAGQRRNKQAKLSWIGFFGSAATLTLTLCTFVFFWMTKLAVG